MPHGGAPLPSRLASCLSAAVSASLLSRPPLSGPIPRSRDFDASAGDFDGGRLEQLEIDLADEPIDLARVENAGPEMLC